MNTDVLIIGAGAAGLMAARELAVKGKKVIVLEAQDRIGGRIHTIYENGKVIELGAEFVHGDLPVTLNLLKESGIKYHSASASMWRYDNGKFTTTEVFIDHWDEFIDKLNKLEQDTSIHDFIETEFPGDKYIELRESVRQFVSGYDTANPKNASSFALRKEWQSEDENAQHRIEGGYIKLLSYLATECEANGGQMKLNSAVKDIYWEPGKVSAIAVDGITYHAERAIIAIPLGVLQTDAVTKGTIVFHPLVKEQQDAIHQMGFGAVIKILIDFNEAFWENVQTDDGKSLRDMGYLFSQEEIPTWWSQFPERSTVFTGWVGGPDAWAKKDATDDELLAESLQSIANIFKKDIDELQSQIRSWHVINWTSRPFIQGSYAYDTVEAPFARKTLNTSVNDTVFFAGEYLYEGPAMGTVEAALTSGKNVAEKIR
ncbi:flavin monoamine oxidase family protein [Mucilaginibacter aquaedulcis]|uniref:flavin monoamine oxidase family protein n=1 Tax=Mucilaginibacter aquaedulcis TaxID=1187081 RepID=UPI0025B4D090|nr:NAD(P)/FAD-dependent oxidoreductase [Mucilaginibacter aquaedulcis]MDN3549375.1 NAD(P)/FAD-dependent oxidoreductase [Mucilaginibacter aquaedulcis]